MSSAAEYLPAEKLLLHWLFREKSKSLPHNTRTVEMGYFHTE